MLSTDWIDAIVEVPAANSIAAPFWSRASVVKQYEHVATVLVYRDASLVASWYVPIVCDESGRHARRQARLTPYCAPWLADGHPERRRRVVVALLRALQEHVESIDLPMAPGFIEVTGCIDLGIEATWRHTRMVPYEPDWRRRYSPKVRNHVKRGLAGSAAIRETGGSDWFDFERGVVEDAQMRARFARVLAKHTQTVCLSAIGNGGDLLGQALVVADAATAYLVHSWFDRRRARGVPSALVDAAISASFERLGVKEFDFEGSILPTVDEFMSGFGPDIRPYPHLRWSTTGSMMQGLPG